MTYEELRPLLEFVGGLMGDLRGWTPQMMAGALTVESVEKAGVVVPPELERALVGFRHRRTVDREAVCRRFLEEGRASGPVPKPAAGVRLGKRDRVTLEMGRGRALELGLLTCACGHPESNHFGRGPGAWDFRCTGGLMSEVTLKLTVVEARALRRLLEVGAVVGLTGFGRLGAG